MRVSLLLLTASAASLSAACELSTAPTTPVAQQVTVSGFAGKGVFSDSVSANAPFQLIASDSSASGGGELVMLGDVVPPTGTYNLDTGSVPQGLSSLTVEFIRPVGAGSFELYQPAGGNMVISSTAGDSIAGSLAFSMPVVGTCTRTQGALSCLPVASVGSKVLSLSGNFLARRAPGATFPQP